MSQSLNFQNGNGYVDTQEKLDRIIKGVEEALAA